MKIGERGQVTIPKKLRERFGLRPRTEVEFRLVKDVLVLEKKPKTIDLRKWKGRCRESFRELGFKSVDEYIENVRGR